MSIWDKTINWAKEHPGAATLIGGAAAVGAYKHYKKKNTPKKEVMITFDLDVSYWGSPMAKWVNPIMFILMLVTWYIGGAVTTIGMILFVLGCVNLGMSNRLAYKIAGFFVEDPFNNFVILNDDRRIDITIFDTDEHSGYPNRMSEEQLKIFLQGQTFRKEMLLAEGEYYPDTK